MVITMIYQLKHHKTSESAVLSKISISIGLIYFMSIICTKMRNSLISLEAMVSSNAFTDYYL